MKTDRRRVILDACVPVEFRHQLKSAEVVTARYMGWQRLTNGKLLDAIEGNFDVLLTVDTSLTAQQNLTGRTLAIVVVRVLSNRLTDLVPLVPKIEAAI